MWPALFLIGGYDQGLRMDGRCFDSKTMNEGRILGVVRGESDTISVVWKKSPMRIWLIAMHLINNSSFFVFFKLTFIFYYFILLNYKLRNLND